MAASKGQLLAIVTGRARADRVISPCLSKLTVFAATNGPVQSPRSSSWGLAAGHLLGGPQSEDRTALALSTSSRHPAVALAMASANFPDQKLIPAAILLYLIVNAIVSLPYLAWRRHRLTYRDCQF